MKLIPAIQSGQICVVIGPADLTLNAALEVVAHLAVRGPLMLIDGGNRLDLFRMARRIRRQTLRLDESLENIRLARAFTCYQMVALLEGAPAGPQPKVALGLLSTFYDESVALAESQRLLASCLHHLRRLSRLAPLLITSAPPRAEQAERESLLAQLEALADPLIVLEHPRPVDQQPLRLF